MGKKFVDHSLIRQSRSQQYGRFNPSDHHQQQYDRDRISSDLGLVVGEGLQDYFDHMDYFKENSHLLDPRFLKDVLSKVGFDVVCRDPVKTTEFLSTVQQQTPYLVPVMHGVFRSFISGAPQPSELCSPMDFALPDKAN